MDKKNKQIAPKSEEDSLDSCENNIVSGTECTGLIQTPPENEQEAESYTDLYAVPEPAEDNKKSKRTGKTKPSGK